MSTPLIPASSNANELHAFLKRLSQVTIRYPRFKEIYDSIQDSIMLTATLGDPHCVALEGKPGAGKTTIAMTCCAASPMRVTKTETHIPVLYTLTPSAPTIKGLCSKMLASLGDPLATQGTQWAMESRLCKLLVKCKVQHIILDEFHGLYDAETDKILAKVSDWLKLFIKETKLPVLVIGREGKVQTILKSNPELSRLFSARPILTPLTWDVNNLQDPYGIWRFMQTAEKAVEVPLTQKMGRRDLLTRLHYATDGLVGLLMNLLRHAATDARKRGQTEIDLPLLSQAYLAETAAHFSNKTNPFVLSDDTDKVLAAPSAQLQANTKKRKSPKLGAVLTTR